MEATLKEKKNAFGVRNRPRSNGRQIFPSEVNSFPLKSDGKRQTLSFACVYVQADYAFSTRFWIFLAAKSDNVPLDMYAQRRLTSSCAFAQTESNLQWAHF